MVPRTKILLIDDRAENLHAMKMTLQPLADVEIHAVQSGNEGLALMLEHDFAVVLLDVQMPGMDGFETATLMQHHKATRNIPIIFVTAISKEEEHVFKGYRSGAVDYLFKPINPDILLSKVRVFVKLYQQRLECERMQQELQKSRNLEALGVLAGGIAHDFNNLLTTIFGYIELAQILSGPETEVHRKLGEAAKAAHRARQLTQQLLTFSKGGRPFKENADIFDLLADTANLMLSGSNVKVHLEKTGAIAGVEVDKGQICQVFQNLLLNAKEAMPDGGNLYIRLENAAVRGEGSAGPLVREGDYVRIIFQDDGPGIDKANLDRIFDPYFSSKKKGATRGQGLGLTIAHSIVKRHDGYIYAESVPGRGATFYIYLPAGGGAPAPSPREEGQLVPPPGPSKPHRKRILVMEDEQSVAATLAEMLQYLGYEVGLAVDGQAALDLYTRARDEGRPFAAAILDLTIRGGEGAEKVLARIKGLDPEVRAIVASGYADNPIMANHRRFGFAGAVSKPFSMAELAAALRHIV